LVLPPLAFRGIYYFGESLLYIEKRTDLAGSIVMAFTLLSVFLNYVLIYHLGMYGAIVVYGLTTIAIGAVAMAVGLRMSPLRIELGRLAVAALLMFALLGAVYALRDASNATYYSTIPLAASAGALLLYTSSFIRTDERRAIESFFGGLKRGFPVGKY